MKITAPLTLLALGMALMMAGLGIHARDAASSKDSTTSLVSDVKHLADSYTTVSAGLADANATVGWCSTRMLPKATTEDINALRCALHVEPQTYCPLVVQEMAWRTQASSPLSLTSINSLGNFDTTGYFAVETLTGGKVASISRNPDIDAEVTLAASESACLHCPSGHRCVRAVVRSDKDVWTLPCKGEWRRGEP